MKKIIALLIFISIIFSTTFTIADNYVQRYEPAEIKAQELTEGCKTQKEKFEKITTWLNYRVSYDYIRMIHLREATGPDIASCFEKESGVCMDIACLACCMFRAVGIKANVAVGIVQRSDYRGTGFPYLHAWCEVYLDGEKIWYDQVAERSNLNKVKTRNTYTYKLQFIRK